MTLMSIKVMQPKKNGESKKRSVNSKLDERLEQRIKEFSDMLDARVNGSTNAYEESIRLKNASCKEAKKKVKTKAKYEAHAIPKSVATDYRKSIKSAPRNDHPKFEYQDVVDRARVVLCPNDQQLRCLQDLFHAPQVLSSLLRDYPEKIYSITDASIFLLQHKNELDPFIDPRRRSESVDILTELLIQWSADQPEAIGIDFENCSISAHGEIYLPLGNLSLLPVIDRWDLNHQIDGSRWGSRFTLFQEGPAFIVAFDLFRKVKVRVKLDKRKVSQRHQPEIAPRLRGNPPDRSKKSRSIQHRKEPRRPVPYTRFAGAFGAGLRGMNWGGLQGWGVSGGLPSLGKASR